MQVLEDLKQAGDMGIHFQLIQCSIDTLVELERLGMIVVGIDLFVYLTSEYNTRNN